MAKWLKNGKSEKEIIEADAEVRKTVEKILQDVSKRGDEAVRELSIKFDNYSPDNFILTKEEIDIAISKVSKRDIDDIKFAQSQVFSKQFNSALETLRKLMERKKIYGSVYQVASEAYVGLKLYNKAEIAALTAINLGVRNSGLLINLANLTAMRGDYIMCQRWLDVAKEIDASDENLIKCQKLLFPNGFPRSTNKPF